MNEYIGAIKKYAVYGGRARRKEYWMFALFNFIFSILALALDNIVKIPVLGGELFYLAYCIGILAPFIAVTVRRLHDVEKSGWWSLLWLVPIIGSIWMLVLVCKGGTVGQNKYGSDPKEESNQRIMRMTQ